MSNEVKRGRPKKYITEEDKERQQKLHAQKALERYHKNKKDEE